MTTNIKELIHGELKEARRDLRHNRFTVMIELQNGLHATYYPEWHRETKEDHLDLYILGNEYHNGRRVLDTPEEWRGMKPKAQVPLIETLRANHAPLFDREPQYINREQLIAETNRLIGGVNKDKTEPETWGMIAVLRRNGLIRIPVLVYFIEPVELQVNKTTKKTVDKATIYFFVSTAGRLCYSSRSGSTRVATGFIFTDELASKVAGIQELK